MPKGVSGNPAGFSKARREAIEGIQVKARRYTQEALDALVEALKTGDRVNAANSLLAYGYGKPQSNVTIRKITSMADLTDEELAMIVANHKAAAQQSSTRS